MASKTTGDFGSAGEYKKWLGDGKPGDQLGFLGPRGARVTIAQKQEHAKERKKLIEDVSKETSKKLGKLIRYEHNPPSWWVKHKVKEDKKLEKSEKKEFKTTLFPQKAALDAQIHYLNAVLKDMKRQGVKGAPILALKKRMQKAREHLNLPTSKEHREKLENLLRGIETGKEGVSKKVSAHLSFIKDKRLAEIDKLREDIGAFKEKVMGGIAGLGMAIGTTLANIGSEVGIGPINITNLFKLAKIGVKTLIWPFKAARWLFGAGRAMGLIPRIAHPVKVRAPKAEEAVPTTEEAAPKKGKARSVKVRAPKKGETPAEETSKKMEEEKVIGMFAAYFRSSKKSRFSLVNLFREHLDQLILFRKSFQKAAHKSSSVGHWIGGFAKGILSSMIGFFTGGLIGSVIPFILKKMLGGLTGLASGALRIVGGIGSVLGKFLKSPAGLVIGAGVAGWMAGSWIYKKFDVQILDAVDKTVHWIGNKFTEAKAFFGKIGEKIADLWGRLKHSVSNIKSAVSGGIHKAIDYTSMKAGDAVDWTKKKAAQIGGATKSITGSIATGAATGATSAVGSVGKGYESMKGYLGKLFRTSSGNVDVQDLHPSVKKNFMSMAQEYKNKTGKTITVNSAFRSIAHQQRIYNKNIAEGSPKKVARPGTSMHNYGYAIDIQSTDANKLNQLGLLQKYGFVRPVSGEPWHIQPKGVSLASAKAGAFSAGAGSSNSAPVNESFHTPAKGTDLSQPNPTVANAGGGKGGLSAIGPSSKVGVNSFPLFSTVDGGLLAMNLNVLANAGA